MRFGVGSVGSVGSVRRVRSQRYVPARLDEPRVCPASDKPYATNTALVARPLARLQWVVGRHARTYGPANTTAGQKARPYHLVHTAAGKGSGQEPVPER